jgi:outer membrane usher protein
MYPFKGTCSRSDSAQVRHIYQGLMAGLFFACPAVSQAALHFPSSMLSGDPGEVADLSHFSQAGAQLPGVYDVEVFLNNQSVGERSLRFVTANDAEVAVAASAPARSADTGDFASPDIHDHTGLVACITMKMWHELGLKTAGAPEMDAIPEDLCVSPGRYIPQAFMKFDFPAMRLDISIPQASIKNMPKGWIPPERWDDGINALLLGYRMSGSNSHGKYNNSRNMNVNLNNGINLGAWRLRDNRNWNTYSARSGGTQSQWQRLNTWAERAIPAWRSQLTLGEAGTGGEIFEPFSFRGVRLASDNSMYPDTLQGFAPTIRGTANSNAKVTIRQNGYLVYQTFVSPGDFAIDDLSSVSSGGDLNVTLTEADGTTRVFTVPYSTVPVLQREGQLRWSVVTGKFRNSSNRYSEPKFIQGSVQWGLPYGITTYGGLQASENYRAGSVGAGMDMGRLGALSMDFTHASSTLADDSHHTGQSVRFLYARSLNSLGTSLTLTGYRYSTQGFHTLDETALKSMSGWLYDYDNLDAEGRPTKRPYTDYYNLYNSKRTQIQANISQQMGDFGSLYLSGSRQTYWNTGNDTTSLQTGYSGTAGAVNYSLSWGYSKVTNQPHSDRQLNLSLSVPLSAFTSTDRDVWSSAFASYNVSRSGKRTWHQAGLSGTLLENSNLSWNAQQGYDRHDGSSGSAGGSYRGTYGISSLGYSYGRNYKQWNYGFSGGAVVHRNGLTLGQDAGNTSILVAAPGAAGVPLSNGTGIRTDWRGYALVPYGTVYRENVISLDASQLDERTELENTAVKVIPTRGALVRADFKAYTGTRVLLTLLHKGKPVPFGATASSDSSSSIVGEDGVVYLSGVQGEGTLSVKWGRGSHQRCTLRYRLTEAQMKESLVQLTDVCL